MRYMIVGAILVVLALTHAVTHDEWKEEREKIEAENVELRKLVKDMFDVYCVLHDEPLTDKQELDCAVEFWERMRALGVDE